MSFWKTQSKGQNVRRKTTIIPYIHTEAVRMYNRVQYKLDKMPKGKKFDQMY